MKILGKTPEGDLIIQVSQAEWDGLQKGKPAVKGSLAVDVLRKEWKSLRRTRGNRGITQGIGTIWRVGLADDLSFNEFVTELHKPDTKFMDASGIGPKLLDNLRKHFPDKVKE